MLTALADKLGGQGKGRWRKVGKESDLMLFSCWGIFFVSFSFFLRKKTPANLQTETLYNNSFLYGLWLTAVGTPPLILPHDINVLTASSELGYSSQQNTFK